MLFSTKILIGLTQYGAVLIIAVVYAFFPRSWENRQFCRSIIDVALSLKSEENKFSISVAPANDNLNNKASELKSEETCVPIDRHRIPIQFVHKTTLIK